MYHKQYFSLSLSHCLSVSLCICVRARARARVCYIFRVFTDVVCVCACYILRVFTDAVYEQILLRENCLAKIE